MNSAKDLSGKTFLIVNTGSGKKKFILQKIKKLGCRIIVLHREMNWAKPYADHWILAETNNHQKTLESVQAFLSQHPEIAIDGVLTFWDDNILLASKLSEKLKLPGNPFAVTKIVKNKHLFRTFCQQHHLPTPRFLLIESPEDVKKIKEKLTFPIVLKPIFGASSAFVIKIETEQELRETYEYVTSLIQNHPESREWETTGVFAEEYIEGDEVDIDLILQNGKVKFWSLTDNFQTSEPFFVETGWAIPSALPQTSQRSLLEMAEEILEKIGIFQGCIHFEAKYSKNGPIPIEVNLRMGGDEAYTFIKTAWKVDFIELSCKLACGMYIPKIKKPEQPFKYLISKDFLSASSGIVTTLEVDSSIAKAKYVKEIQFSKQIGDPLLVPPEGYEYLGWVATTGDNPLEAENNLAKVLKHIHFEVASFRPDSSIGQSLRRTAFSAAILKKNLIMEQVKIQRLKKISRSDQEKLRIGVVANRRQQMESGVDYILTSAGEDIVNTLRERGYDVRLFLFENIFPTFSELRKNNIDLIFNVCEKLHDSGMFEPHAAALLDILQIPYTGSTPLTLGLCKDKIQFKKLLHFHNIPTPAWDYVFEPGEEIRNDLHFPLIVKPAYTDDSIGISNESVVSDKKALRKQVEKLLQQFRMPILIEEYIEGDEYDVSIFGNDESDDLQVLPLTRSVFANFPKDYWHIYSFQAKYGLDPTYNNIVVEQPPKIRNNKLSALLTEIGIDTYNILRCRDYGKVEIRVDQRQNPYVIELNPNPSLDKDALFPTAAQVLKMDYGDVLEKIITITLNRYHSM